MSFIHRHDQETYTLRANIQRQLQVSRITNSTTTYWQLCAVSPGVRQPCEKLTEQRLSHPFFRRWRVHRTIQRLVRNNATRCSGLYETIVRALEVCDTPARG